jgi:TolA-binding protein
MDELGARARAELEPAWDDVHETRVLSSILADAGEPKAQRPRKAMGVLAVVVVAAVAAVVLGVGRFGGVPKTVKSAPVVVVEPAPIPELGSSVLSLGDGSKAHLRAGAELEPLEQTKQVVRIVQRRGEVRYEVKPDLARPFTVQARDVEVSVIGTVFTVNIEGDGVHVSVERGRVAVRSGERRVELSPGETLRLSSAESASAPIARFEDKAEDARAAQPQPSDVSSAAAAAMRSPVELLAEADAARARGDLATAERALGALLAQHPRAPQAASAAFSLGRIQSARGNFTAAARTFEMLRRQAPRGPLAEDALAEAANASALSGQRASARSLAEQYLRQYPSGAHAERMRRLGTR